MNPRIPSLRLAAALAAAAFVTVGCKRESAPPPQTMNFDQVAPTLEQQMSGVAGDTKAQVDGAMNAIKDGNDPAALVQLESLAESGDLTPEQRRAAAESAMAVRTKLLEKATQGDSDAAAFLQMQRARK